MNKIIAHLAMIGIFALNSNCYYSFKVIPDVKAWQNGRDSGNQILTLTKSKVKLSGASDTFVKMANDIKDYMDKEPKYLPIKGSWYFEFGSSIDTILQYLEDYQIYIAKRLETVKLIKAIDKKTGSDHLFIMQRQLDSIINRVLIWQKKVEKYREMTIKIVSTIAKVAALANGIDPSVITFMENIISGQTPDRETEAAMNSLLIKAQTDAKNKALDKQLSYLKLVELNPDFEKASKLMESRIKTKQNMNNEKAKKISSFVVSQLYDFAIKNPNAEITELRKEFAKALSNRDQAN